MTAPLSLTVSALQSGGKAAIAQALTAIEERAEDADVVALLDAAWLAPRAHVIGLTGPPGVGKSTLIDALIRQYREMGETVAVVAVDPSSRKTGGALLGDRTRFQNNPDDDGVFVRSLAARGQLGGLAALAFPSVVLLSALYDRVLVETVGVGQSEADVSGVAQTVVLCVQPGSGDSLQFMKAGIMEIPDVAVVTKADVGPSARQALADLKGALSLTGSDAEQLAVSSQTGEGLAELVAACDAHRRTVHVERRADQASDWLRGVIASRFGAEGCAALGDAMRLADGKGPFGQAQHLMREIEVMRRS
ncbi:MAG: ArgK/MeaB family GTPase [Hyphomicrobiaceae bacterium]